MKKKHILYVEDYPVIQTMYAEVLRKNGYTVDTAPDGKEALAKIKDHKYDLVILDLLLPNVTGVEFLQKYVKSHPADTVVVLTDFNKPETVEQVKGLGVDNYWIKVETTPYQLAERLTKLFNKKGDN